MRQFEPVGGGGIVGDAVGAYGRVYEYNSAGNIRIIRNLNARGAVLVDNTGVAEVRRQYDANGRVMAVEWRTRDGTPALNDQGYSVRRMSRDGQGRSIGTRLEGIDGAGVPRRDFWYR